MKIHGKRRKNYILEVTPLELDTIQTALFEYGQCVAEGPFPLNDSFNRRFHRIFDRVSKTAGRFDLLRQVKVLERKTTKKLEDKKYEKV